MQIFTWWLTFTLSFLPAAGFAPAQHLDDLSTATEEEWAPGLDPSGLQAESQDDSDDGEWKPGIDPNGIALNPSQSELDGTN